MTLTTSTSTGGSGASGGGKLPRHGRRATPLSPDQIRNIELPRTTLGRRGYSETEVDTLLRRLATEVESWVSENTGLRVENERLKNAWREWHRRNQPEVGHLEPKGLAGQPNPDAVLVMSRAQQEADSLIAQAQDYARRITEHARTQYEEVLRSAQLQAQDEAEAAVLEYRARAGSGYAAEIEELERRLAWTRTFLGAIEGVEVQLKSAREALSLEVEKIGVTALEAPRH